MVLGKLSFSMEKNKAAFLLHYMYVYIHKGMTEDEMVGLHHRLNGHEFECVLGDGE